MVQSGPDYIPDSWQSSQELLCQVCEGQYSGLRLAPDYERLSCDNFDRREVTSEIFSDWEGLLSSGDRELDALTVSLSALHIAQVEMSVWRSGSTDSERRFECTVFLPFDAHITDVETGPTLNDLQE